MVQGVGDDSSLRGVEVRVDKSQILDPARYTLDPLPYTLKPVLYAQTLRRISCIDGFVFSSLDFVRCF